MLKTLKTEANPGFVLFSDPGNPNIFSGYTALCRRYLNDEVPKEISLDEMSQNISEDTLNRAALRVENLKKLKTEMQKQFMRRAFEGTEIILNSLRGKSEGISTMLLLSTKSYFGLSCR